MADAVKALYAPDLSSERIEYAKHVLVPVVLLSDYELTEQDHDYNSHQVRVMWAVISGVGVLWICDLGVGRALGSHTTTNFTRLVPAQENFMHMNLTHVEKALGSIMDEQQEVVVVSAVHPLSRHTQLMAALWKARRSKSDQALLHQGGSGG